MRGLFLYNPADLNSGIPGGVQICSKEYLKVIQEVVAELYFFEVKFSKSVFFRILYKLNLDAYKSYNPKKYKTKLIDLLINKKITHVFINKSELIKFSKLIKEANLKTVPKIIIMSHGNESGDLLGNLTAINSRFKILFNFFGIIKLGMTLFLESWFRKRYVDLVCTMSEEESSLEKWLGVNNPIFLPRPINRESKIFRSPIKNVFGYVGTLNHSPNINAIHQLCEKLKVSKLFSEIEIRIVGQPESIGKVLEKQYSFIKYLGVLSDQELLEEIKNWAFFINPIFNYSRGASMKLGKAITWELPIITTFAGRRGYLWTEGNLIEVENSPDAFVAVMENCMLTESDYEEYAKDITKVKQHSPNISELANKLKEQIQINNH